jgi:hypothetical protein
MPLGPIPCPDDRWTLIHDRECLIQVLTVGPLWIMAAPTQPSPSLLEPPTGAASALLTPPRDALSTAGILPAGTSLWGRPRNPGEMRVTVFAAS